MLAMTKILNINVNDFDAKKYMLLMLILTELVVSVHKTSTQKNLKISTFLKPSDK